MEMTKVIMVGGFLGAGKTSMLMRLADTYEDRKIGLITNDQATGMVDTALLEKKGKAVKEVSGSCFCCNFPGFADAVEYLAKENNGGIVIAEPVGSCTDLSATIMQPLKDKYKEWVDLAPLTVMADPDRIKLVLDNVLTSGNYIIRKQFEEADVIFLNKIDLLSEEELTEFKKRIADEFPNAILMCGSVKTGEGLTEWFETVCHSDKAGQKITEVDYDIYAAGEAAYGWLNAEYVADDMNDPEEKAEALLKNLAQAFDGAGISVGHVKFLLQTKEMQCIGNITGTESTASIRKVDVPGEGILLTVNARTETDPETLERIVRDGVDNAFGKLENTVMNVLIPGRPNPTYRYSEVV